ncbi:MULTISPECIES: ABC-ATPase domain-containing protein [unclassified Oceanispirochaeta]|uniref:ABC-ATPase domain-containing protein n=1 Tax=unclassified Oceanispirochaeta TaxID=2635722 RepID=UPI001314D828|nr:MULTISPECIES: ABC-ATPase domain-containing protein [unclassified Oceanispirochaeta]MBF9015997.1 ABC-ATPase domain-containing protein [Oceanispirochaeta sp. M2]NPD72460.1 ABC-ATPase domain-containing protein [Oceanispirochaeta sp. M1]
MLDKIIIRNKLAAIDGKDYAAYQSLIGTYNFNLFTLIIQQIPKDPYAPPHTGIYRIQIPRNDNRIIRLTTENKNQNIACSDFLARRFFEASRQISKGIRGTGFSGIITINQPGQAILERNSVLITNDMIEIRCFLGLPAKGRKITSQIAESMLIDELTSIVEKSLLQARLDQKTLEKHIAVAEDAEYLRNKLKSLGLIAFIADNSILARESGTSDKPMTDLSAIPCFSPQSLMKEIVLPHAGKIGGMGIPKGITLITGGGYHGKSTLLKAMEVGIYNHIPGDGRERCVSNKKSVKIRAYSGRSVEKTDISPFIKNLPYQNDTTLFCTENASGSTSQAASIIEAVEVGAELLLMDEDTCATNFMIRDSKMQQLVNKEDEPITTFIDKAQQLYSEMNISTVIVLGGVGDYFDISDLVIQMKKYQPTDVTSRSREIVKMFPGKRKNEDEGSTFTIRERIPISESIDPYNDYGKFAIYAKETHRLNFGNQVIDLSDLEQLIELSQTKALGFAIEYAKKIMNEEMTLREVVNQITQDIDEHGIDVISHKISGHFACFRSLELAFALNRLRGFKVIQREINPGK